MQLLPEGLDLGAALEVHILDAAQDAGLPPTQCLDWGLRTTPTGETELMVSLKGSGEGGGGGGGGWRGGFERDGKDVLFLKIQLTAISLTPWGWSMPSI